MAVTADYVPYIVYIVGATFVIACNIPLTLAILIPKRNRERKEFILITGLTVSDIIYAATFLLAGTRRIRILDEGVEAEKLERRFCSFGIVNILSVIGNQLVGLCTCAVAIDRLFAVLVPVKHYLLGPRYAWGFLMIPTIWVSIPLALNLIINSEDRTLVPIYCVNNVATNPTIYSYMNLLRMICVALSGVIYTIVVLLLKKRHKKTLQLSQSQQRSIQKATVTMGLITINAVLLLFIPDFFLYTNYFNLAKDYVLVLYCIILARTCFNFFIIMARHKELREELIKVVFRKDLVVSVSNSKMLAGTQKVGMQQRASVTVSGASLH